jgi:DNA-binding CsgD family transcriptional regulator
VQADAASKRPVAFLRRLKLAYTFAPSEREALATEATLAACLSRVFAKAGTAVGYFTVDGKPLWKNQSLTRLLTEPRDGERLRRELRLAVRSFVSPPTASSEQIGRRREATTFHTWRFRTRDGAYSMLILHAGDDDDEQDEQFVLALVLCVRPDAGDAVSGLRKRFHLTAREQQVMRLLLRGMSNTEIAHTLGISAHTARHHTERVFTKVDVRSRWMLRSVALEALPENW